jgi:Family of unknown function (DUF6059)
VLAPLHRLLTLWWRAVAYSGWYLFVTPDGPYLEESPSWATPGPGHPEQLAAHVPPDPVEERLWAQLAASRGHS